MLWIFFIFSTPERGREQNTAQKQEFKTEKTGELQGTKPISLIIGSILQSEIVEDQLIAIILIRGLGPTEEAKSMANKAALAHLHLHLQSLSWRCMLLMEEEDSNDFQMRFNRQFNLLEQSAYIQTMRIMHYFIYFIFISKHYFISVQP